jgi:hypothetical protein
LQLIALAHRRAARVEVRGDPRRSAIDRRFRQRVEAVIEKFKDMREDLDR